LQGEFLQKPHTNWHAYRRVPASFMPRSWQEWVLDRGSLTKRLQQASHGDFYVRVNRQTISLPSLSERRALKLGLGRHALVREVELVCHDEVWVRARSVIPLATLSGEERQLRSLGTKPLGAFLFASRSMKREQLEISRYANVAGASFARRSIFKLHDKPLLVVEHFCNSVICEP